MTTPCINLVPGPRRMARQRRMRARTWGTALAGWCIVLVLVCAGARMAWPSDGGQTARDLQSARGASQKATAALVEATKKLTQARKTQSMINLVRDQPDWSILLTLVGNRLGSETVLREVRLAPVNRTDAPVPMTPAATAAALPVSPRQYKLHLRGFGKSQASVSQFVSAMEKSELFEQVKLMRTGREPFLNASAVTFELECDLGEGSKK